MCEDISIADDFDVQLGVVRGGVSLLIRPSETNPTSPDIFRTVLLRDSVVDGMCDPVMKSGFLGLAVSVGF